MGPVHRLIKCFPGHGLHRHLQAFCFAELAGHAGGRGNIQHGDQVAPGQPRGPKGEGFRARVGILVVQELGQIQVEQGRQTLGRPDPPSRTLSDGLRAR